MKVMFISKELHQTAGSGVGARMHRDVLLDLVGEQNVYTIDVSPNVARQKKKNYISFGKYKSALDRIVRHIQGNTYLFSNDIIKDICSVIQKENIDLVFVDDSYFGKLVKSIKKNNPQVIVVSFFHDVKAELFPIWIRRSRKLIQKLDYKLAIWNERVSVEYADANIVLNKYEDDLLKKYYEKCADYYLPVCVNREQKEAENPYLKTNKRHILFVGTAYYPNIQGIKWFYQNVFSSIKDQFDLWIIGKGLEILKNHFDDEDVHVVGFVDSLAPYYEFADTIIAPLTDGGGMKIKTAEAFSYGKNFVGSSESLHGYYEELPTELIGSVVFQCDTAKEYIQAFQCLANKKETTTSETLVELYEKKYSPLAAKEIMSKIIYDNTENVQ